MVIREMIQHRRRCSKSGHRTEGKVYLGSELSEDGTLPAFVENVPARPYDQPFCRGIFQIDLAAMLGWEDYESYIAGTTKQRRIDESIREPEEAAFGMPMDVRQAIGICRSNGLGAITKLVPTSCQGLGRHIRALSRVSPDKEIARSLVAFARQDWAQVLASLWRGWRKYDKDKRNRIYTHVAAAMIALGASEDALELR